MITGEKMLAAVWSGDAIYIMNENPDMKYVIPEEGSNKWVDALCIPKDAPNKAGVKHFSTSSCDPENSKENVDYIGILLLILQHMIYLMMKLKIIQLHILLILY